MDPTKVELKERGKWWAPGIPLLFAEGRGFMHASGRKGDESCSRKASWKCSSEHVRSNEGTTWNGWTSDGLHAVFIDSNHELINMLDGALEDCHVVPRSSPWRIVLGYRIPIPWALCGTVLSIAPLSLAGGGRAG
jgi:hypothetical protein